MGNSHLPEIRRLAAVTQNALVKFHLKLHRRAPGQVDDALIAAWEAVEAGFGQLCAAIDEDKGLAARIASHGATYVQEISKTNADNYRRRVTCVAAFLDGLKSELQSSDKAA